MSEGKSAAEVAKVVMQLVKKGIEVSPQVIENLHMFAKAGCDITDNALQGVLPGAKIMSKAVGQSGGRKMSSKRAMKVLKKYYGSKKRSTKRRSKKRSTKRRSTKKSSKRRSSKRRSMKRSNKRRSSKKAKKSSKRRSRRRSNKRRSMKRKARK